MTAPFSRDRGELFSQLFPIGIPTLWCPLLTHYTAEGAIDRARMAAHWQHLASWVNGYLIPGSTGDGWEMNDAEIEELLGFAVEQTAALKVHLLIGVLKPGGAETLDSVRATAERLCRRIDSTDRRQGLRAAGVCGFTVCAPRGAEQTQAGIETALAAVLEEGLPTALYQLPQVTQNELGPDLAADLARRYPNFILFKDSSGRDQVALSGVDLQEVFLLRGAEGEYGRWLKAGGGPYHGLLLSTANCFGRELQEILDRLEAGRISEARSLCARLTAVVQKVFAQVQPFPHGNAFANANKAIDHFQAFGPRAAAVTSPRLHAGVRLPETVIQATGEALAQHGLLPARGYLE